MSRGESAPQSAEGARCRRLRDRVILGRLDGPHLRSGGNEQIDTGGQVSNELRFQRCKIQIKFRRMAESMDSGGYPCP